MFFFRWKTITVFIVFLFFLNMMSILLSVCLLLVSTPLRATAECETPTNDGVYSSRVSLEKVCLVAACAHAGRNTENDGYASELNKQNTVDEESSGAELIEALLTGKESTPSGATWDGYINDVLVVAAIPGAILAFLCYTIGLNAVCSRLICSCFCPKWRCCCTCAPGTEKPYSKIQTLEPIVVWGGASAVAFILATVGMSAGATKFGNAFIRGGCMIDTTRIRINGFIDNLIVPVHALNNEFAGVVTTVDNNLGNTDGIKTSMETMVNKFDTLASVAAEYPCTVAVGIADATEKAKKSVHAAAKSLEGDLAEVRLSIKSNLLDQQDTISASTAAAVESADNMKSAVDVGLGSASKQSIMAAKLVSDNMASVVLGPFLWVYIVICGGVGGIVLMKLCKYTDTVEAGDLKTNINMEGSVHRLNFLGGMGARVIAISWFVAFICAGVTGIFATVAMPGSQLYIDGCQAIVELPLQLSTQTTTETTTTTQTQDEDGNVITSSDTSSTESSDSTGEVDLISGCWKNMSVYTILGLDESLSFDDIDFSKSDDMDVNLDPEGDMKKLETKINELPDVASCSVAKKKTKEAFDAAKASMGAVETEIKDYQSVLGEIQEASILKLLKSADAIIDAYVPSLLVLFHFLLLSLRTRF